MAPARRNRRSNEDSEEPFDFLGDQRSPAKAPNTPPGTLFHVHFNGALADTFGALNTAPPTEQQREAIAARGNVLVVAGAGAGKTRTLVDRCLAWLLEEQNHGSVDEVLMVTFTQAAAAEMRLRLRAGLENAPAPSPRLAEQLALLETAHISTLHSFCFHLVGEHFYELGLEPRLTVLSDEETQVLARQTLDEMLEEVYGAEAPAEMAIQQLIQAQGGDWDQPVRNLIRRLHSYAQSLRDPAAWFAAQQARFQREEPEEWRGWLMEELNRWRGTWLPALQGEPPANKNAVQCAAALAELPPNPSRREYAAALAKIGEADKNWPRPKGPWRDPIKEVFEEGEFLQSVCAEGAVDPLQEDWNWVRPSMLALLDATGRFGRAFGQAKRATGGIDFHDLEQFALRLLWENGQPSAVARQWREKLRLIFVDEFQDINGAQAAIIEALAREGGEANRFLVGDVKQSIYRFRLADPGIFVRCQAEWEKAGSAGRVVTLSDNFRSDEGIVDFVNALFGAIMRPEIGGVAYDEGARLRFGGREGRGAAARDPASPPPVELHLRARGRGGEEEGDESASDAEKEARMVGRRLRELWKTPVTEGGQTRAAKWSDMAILLRSPRNKVEAYVKEFNGLGIPLSAARGGFYDSLEVGDLLALLQVLDNPLQDLPLLAVLRSPLAGLTSAELAAIRIARPHGRFWTALVDWHREETRAGDSIDIERARARDKAGRFVSRYRDWRRQARRGAVSQCLESVIEQTHYTERLLAQERGEQKRADVERFLYLARQFDAGRGESLPRFLRFVEAQQESEAQIEPAAAPEGEAVRLMSIHQSKGLEFPIVVVADLGKRFNFSDLREPIIVDEQLGLCPQIKVPDTPQLYPSLAYWLAQRRQKREALGEEMRLLYVAMTRAMHRLILAGTASQSKLEEKWPERAKRGLGMAELLRSVNYLDWIGPWLAGQASLAASGRNALLSWRLESEAAAAEGVAAEAAASVATGPDITPEIRDRLDWRYPQMAATQRPAKSSVSVLRREMAGEGEEEAAPYFMFDTMPYAGRGKGGRLTAAEIGSAHHRFLELVALERAGTVGGLREEAARLGRENRLSSEEIGCLDFEALAAFWQSSVGAELLARLPWVRRELPFTARFGVKELAPQTAMGGEEFVVVQGVIDLAAILPEEIWLVDFKTDHFPAEQLPEKIQLYRPQLALYGEAIGRIHRRPVTRRWLHFLAHRHTADV